MIIGDPLRKILDAAVRDLELPANYQPQRTKR
jgi:hypothetical protein